MRQGQWERARAGFEAVLASRESLLDELGPVGEQVWLGLREAELAYHTAGDMAYTRQLAADACELAADLDLLDAEMMGLALEGLALVGLGEVDEGLRRLDEATVAAVGGELESYKAVAAICCFMIFACERVRDIERAAQWCEQYMAYCDRNAMPAIWPSAVPITPRWWPRGGGGPRRRWSWNGRARSCTLDRRGR